MADRQTTLAGNTTKPYRDEDILEPLHRDDEKSVQEIADILDCTETTVRNYLKRFGITEPTESPATHLIRPDGYECWRVDGHTIYVHRLVAIAEWGIEAVADGVIHHKNRIRWDNRPENLRVFETQGKHSRHHARPQPHEDQLTLDGYQASDQPIRHEPISRNSENQPEHQQLTFDDF